MRKTKLALFLCGLWLLLVLPVVHGNSWKKQTKIHCSPVDSAFDQENGLLVIACLTGSGGTGVALFYNAILPWFFAGNVSLPAAPASIDIRDGFIVVGHNNSMSVLKYSRTPPFHPVTAYPPLRLGGNITKVTLAANGTAFAFVQGQLPGYFRIDVLTKHVAHYPSSNVTGSIAAKTYPGGTSVYFETLEVAPQQLYDLNVGTLSETSRQCSGNCSLGSDWWYSADGTRMISSVGTVFATAPETPNDMAYIGQVEKPSTCCASLFQTPAMSNTFLGVDRQGLQLFEYAYPSLTLRSNLTVPSTGAGAFFLKTAYIDPSNNLIGLGAESRHGGVTWYALSMPWPFPH